MLDAEYFRTQLEQDIAACGGDAVVELRVLTGQLHRLRTIERITDGYVVVQAYQVRTDGGPRKDASLEQRFGATSEHDLERAIIPYESMLDVVLVPSQPREHSKIGFPTR